MSAEKTNTRAQGDAFRDRVYALLRMLPGLRVIEREHPVGHQAVDIYYEELASFGVVPVACECKDYGSPLTRSQLETKIWPKYGPLLQNKEVKAVRVITPFPVGVDAQRYAQSVGFTITTVDDLESGIMDFGVYLRAMRSQFAEGGLDQYYLPVRFDNQADAEDFLTTWLNGEHSRPIAVLATYGMGKSSLAKRMAWLQAGRHLANNQARIPILIQLQDISTEQDIRGLITKHLAAQHVVHNFHYELFCELNRRGRFFLIFDGFDEMRQAMSFSDLRFNFSEINRLVEGHSRVLLLGRPTVFKDAAERQYALHGIRGETQRRVSDAPDYVELEIQDLDAARAHELMQTYGRYALTHSAAIRGEAISAEAFEERLLYVRNHPELSVLSQRPVQARMLVDLALDPYVEWRTFSRYELYQEFVQRFLEREALKRARQRFTAEQRERFQRELAWWMWTSDHASGFEVRALPRELFSQHTAHPDEADGVARDLLMGTVLDSKSQDRYYFRHRSYLEFLVAQHVCTEEWTARSLAAVPDRLTEEIAAFIKDSPEIERLDPLHTWVNDVEIALPRLFIDLLAYSSYKGGSSLALEPTSSARDVFIYWHAIEHQKINANEVLPSLARGMRDLVDRESRIACITCMMLYACGISSIDGDRDERILSDLRYPLSALLMDTQTEMQRLLDHNRNAPVALDPEAWSMRLVAQSMVRQQQRGAVYTIDLNRFFGAAEHLLEDGVRLSDWTASAMALLETEVSLRELAIIEPSLTTNKPSGSVVQRFFEKFPNPSMLVPVRKKVAPQVRRIRPVLGLRPRPRTNER